MNKKKLDKLTAALEAAGYELVKFAPSASILGAIDISLYLESPPEKAEQTALEKMEKALGSTDKLDNNSVEINLTLPKADIGGLHFNKQKVHAVFEKQENDWWQSKDILFQSARNTEDDNSRDILTEYLNDDRIKKQIGDLFNLPSVAVAVTLPRENQGIKQYHGVDDWYWLAGSPSGSAAYFCYVHYDGAAAHNTASAVGGCAPAFRVAERHS
jgi:hypothetical protein